MNIDKYENNIINNIKAHNKNIKAIGFDLQFDLILSLTNEQYESFNINFSEINNLEYIKEKFNENIFSFIKLSSNNFLFNIILFINRANIIKSNIKYIIPFVYNISKEISFINDIIYNILKNEGIFLIPLNLTKKIADIKFIFNLIENNKIISTKKYFIQNNCDYTENRDNIDDNNINNNNNNKIDNNSKNKLKKNKKVNSNINKIDEAKIKSLINSLNKCDFVLTTSDNINHLIEIFKEHKSFDKIIKYFELKKLCIIYDIPLMKNFAEKIISVTDIYFFEQSDLNLFFNTNNNKSNNNNNNNFIKNKKEIFKLINYIIKQIEQKDNKTLKIEIIIDKLMEINIIQHDPGTQLLIENFKDSILVFGNKKFINNKNEEIILDNNYNYLKSIYIGAFLSRLFYSKTYNTCLIVSIKCLLKAIKLFKNNLNYLKEDNNTYYTTLVKKNLNHSKSVQNLKYSKLESQFILDGKNICEMNSKNAYNSLYDDNCISFFESINNRNFLYKQGFLNKKGKILADPDRIIKIFDIKNKKRINCYQNEMNKFYNIKIKNDISQKLIGKLSLAKNVKIDKNNFTMQTFNILNKQFIKKENIIPSLKDNNNKVIFGNQLYNKEVKKIKVNSNINKRYFKGSTFNKTFYKSIYKNNSTIKNARNKPIKNIDYFKYKHRAYLIDNSPDFLNL